MSDDTEVQIRETCPTCHGSGEQPWSMTICRRCDGSGKATRWMSLNLLLEQITKSRAARDSE